MWPLSDVLWNQCHHCSFWLVCRRALGSLTSLMSLGDRGWKLGDRLGYISETCLPGSFSLLCQAQAGTPPLQFCFPTELSLPICWALTKLGPAGGERERKCWCTCALFQQRRPAFLFVPQKLCGAPAGLVPSVYRPASTWLGSKGSRKEFASCIRMELWSPTSLHPTPTNTLSIPTVIQHLGKSNEFELGGGTPAPLRFVGFSSLLWLCLPSCQCWKQISVACCWRLNIICCSQIPCFL